MLEKTELNSRLDWDTLLNNIINMGGDVTLSEGGYLVVRGVNLKKEEVFEIEQFYGYHVTKNSNGYVLCPY